MTTDERESLYLTGEILPWHYCNSNLTCPFPSISLSIVRHKRFLRWKH